MNALRRLLVTLATAFCLTGCFQIGQTITVRSDGSGTVVMSVKMTKEMIEQMKGLGNVGGGKDGGNPLDGMLSDAEAKEVAKKMGEGVKLDKVEAFKEGKFEGKRATFSFPDVNGLTLDMDLNGMNPKAPGDAGVEKDAVTFQFTKGSPATLIINSKHRKPDPRKTPEVEDPDEAAGLAMAQQFLKDSRMTVVVRVEGTITETDATHKDASGITLADIPFGDLLKDASKLKALKNANTWDEAAKVFKGIPSIKIETREKVSVKFK